MASVSRIRAIWTGFPGSPGYTNWYMWDASDPADPDVATSTMRAFFQSVRSVLPADVSIQVQQETATVDLLTGSQVDVVPASVEPAVVTGGSVAGSYSASSGALVSWHTAGVRKGRLVRGRSYLVPISGVSYANDGTLQTSTITTVQSAAAAAIGVSSATLVVFSAKLPGDETASAAEVTSASVPDLAVVMRSRRQ